MNVLRKHPSCDKKRKSHSSIRNVLSQHFPTERYLSKSQEPFEQKLPERVPLLNSRKKEHQSHKRKLKLFQLYIGNKLKSQLQRYFHFLLLVNYSHRCLYKKYSKCKYLVYVGKGNNSKLIKEIFTNRFWWKITNKQAEANVVWTQNSQKPLFEKIRETENSNESTNKIIKISPNKKIKEEFNILSEQDKRRIKYEKQLQINVVKKIKTTCNHIQNNGILTKKKNLFHSLFSYCQKFMLPLERIVPLTFHIQNPIDLQPIFNYEDIPHKKKLMWIVKPGENTNRGCGIQVCKNVLKVKQHIQKELEKYPQRTFIVQKYIMPFLYHRRKFDIRCFVLITATPQISAYFYMDGYIRTSSFQFKVTNCTNKYIHLTNDAIQKKALEYNKFQLGNKITFQQFQDYLNLFYFNKHYNFRQQIFPQLKDLAKTSILSTNNFEGSKIEHCFQLLGYDFMIDEHFTPWLIEVNKNPCLETGCPVLDHIIPAMLQNVMKIAIDPVMVPPKLQKWPAKEFFTCPLRLLQQNKFQLLYTQIK